MIRVNGLTKIFSSGLKAINQLDLEVRKGEILALLGPNGAGKTTTIRVLSTLSGFDEGEVFVAGHNVDTEPEQVRRAIGVVAQQTGVDYFLTGRENLELQGHLYRMSKAEIAKRIDELGEYFELGDALDRLVMTYSGGMRRKLDIATALIHKPEVVFLDEPTLGLDIKSRKSLWNYIRKLNQDQGLTILLTTHYLEEADKLSDRVAIIASGQIRVIDDPEKLKNDIHGDAVILTFDTDGPEVGDFTYALHDDPEVKEIVWDNDNIHLYVDDGSKAVPKFVALAAEKGVGIKTLQLAHPTLDDVFLKYTGSTLEDNNEEEGEEWWHQWAGKGGGGGKWEKNWQKWQEQLEASGDEEKKASWAAHAQQWQQKATEESAAPQKEEAPTAAKGDPQDQSWPNQEWGNSDKQGDWPQQDDWQKSNKGK